MCDCCWSCSEFSYTFEKCRSLNPCYLEKIRKEYRNFKINQWFSIIICPNLEDYERIEAIKLFHKLVLTEPSFSIEDVKLIGIGIFEGIDRCKENLKNE